MDFYKYYVPSRHGGYTLGIKSNTYAKSFDYVNQLVAIAKSDFPQLQDKDIQVVVYGGDRWKRQMGIEFQLDERTDAFDSYREHGSLEYTLA